MSTIVMFKNECNRRSRYNEYNRINNLKQSYNGLSYPPLRIVMS